MNSEIQKSEAVALSHWCHRYQFFIGLANGRVQRLQPHRSGNLKKTNYIA
jgi:hypothetical protein